MYSEELVKARFKELVDDFGGQRQLAEKIRYSQSSISKILAAKEPNFSGPILAEISKLGISIEWLLGISEEKYLPSSSDVTYYNAVKLLSELIRKGVLRLDVVNTDHRALTHGELHPGYGQSHKTLLKVHDDALAELLLIANQAQTVDNDSFQNILMLLKSKYDLPCMTWSSSDTRHAYYNNYTHDPNSNERVLRSINATNNLHTKGNSEDT